jgi:hypothetical protein
MQVIGLGARKFLVSPEKELKDYTEETFSRGKFIMQNKAKALSLDGRVGRFRKNCYPGCPKPSSIYWGLWIWGGQFQKTGLCH